VLKTQERLTNLSRDMVETLTTLRIQLLECPKCIAIEGCPIRESVNTQVNIAIQEITEEWDLKSIVRKTKK